MLPISRIMSLILRRHGKWGFLSKIDHNDTILDVGCGNESPQKTKIQIPNCHYTGIDVVEQDENPIRHYDRLIISQPENFHKEIGLLQEEYDAVISSHNLEHCNDRWGTLESMASKVKLGGSIFLAFPSEESVNFPSRDIGCLNYYDNKEHLETPPDFSRVVNTLIDNGFEITFSKKRYRPNFLWFLGFFTDKFHRANNKVGFCTWEYFGFESIIWAKRVA